MFKKISKQNIDVLRKLAQDCKNFGEDELCQKLVLVIKDETGLENSHPDLSYSSVMRKLRKEHPDKIKHFMKKFKETFDDAVEQELNDPDRIALLAALKEINYEE